MATEPGLDIGLFSKRTILTGAGWTRNWGGQLASELWQDLMSNHAIQDRGALRDLLLEEHSFEAALGTLRSGIFSAQDRHTFERGLMDAFVAMDTEIGRPGRQPWINIYKVRELLFRFWGERQDRVDSGYMFTLNQDLWPERYLCNVTSAAAPTLPGIQRRTNQRLFTTDLGYYNDGFIMQPLPNLPTGVRLSGAFNVIKLHGSFNWRTTDGQNAMVVGTEKTAQISALPLLAVYWQIFRAVLQAGGVRLMVVGYGFGDEHVNAVIADAVRNHGLRVFIWDTAPDLKQRILSRPHGPEIWRGILSMASRPMIEVFPSVQAVTAEYGRITATMFG